jgi:hypothetical protein
MLKRKIDRRRCLACGRVHDAAVLVCDCGTDMSLAQPMVVPNRPGASVGPGSGRSPFRTFVLYSAMVITALFVLACLLKAAVAIYEGDWWDGLLIYPPAAICGMAMLYVFSDAVSPTDHRA